MPFTPLEYDRRPLRLHKCRRPDLDSHTILVTDLWDYVEMWLRRNDKDEALLYWRQAEAFYNAAKDLPNTSSPLLHYYSAMNATKALLLSKGLAAAPAHGLSGRKVAGKTSLTREIVRIKAGGLFPALCHYVGEPAVDGTDYTLKDIFYNLAFVHRAYTVTFRTASELFIPIYNPVFVRLDGAARSWLKFQVKDKRFQHPATLNTFTRYERDNGVQDDFIVRCRGRFDWRDTDTDQVNLGRFLNYHARCRTEVTYIRGLSRLWYLKRPGATNGRIERCSLTLSLMALHRLSEMARYSPDSLSRHFECQHNWLLSEFISLALDQYLDEIAAEMTGHEFMPPGISPR